MFRSLVPRPRRPGRSSLRASAGPPRPREATAHAADRLVLAVAAVAAIAAFLPAEGGAQATPRSMEGVRVGVTVGGTGTLGVSVEWIGEGLRSVEATVSTWGFRDVGLGLAGRHYFGGGYLRPVLGAGLWLTHSFAEGGSGTAVLGRAPLGFDWRAAGEQFLGVTVAANRVIWMVRRDPESSDLPGSSGRLVPIPELAWRWRP